MGNKQPKLTTDSGTASAERVGIPILYPDGPPFAIDSEFSKLIPPLEALERETLKEAILGEGIRHPLVVWQEENLLIDGHNRLDISNELGGLPYAIEYRSFPSRAQAILWIVTNQIGRRNLNAFVKGELALRMKPAIQEAAKDNMAAGGRGDEVQQTVNTREIIAERAGVSPRTLGKIEKVTKEAPAYVKEAARSGSISVDRATQVTDAINKAPPQTQQLAVDHQLTDPKVIDAIGKAEVEDPSSVQDILDSGVVMNLDGEHMPIADANSTDVQIAVTEEAYERTMRQAEYIRAALAKKAGVQSGELVLVTCPCCEMKTYRPIDFEWPPQLLTAAAEVAALNAPEEVSDEPKPIRRGRGRPAKTE